MSRTLGDMADQAAGELPPGWGIQLVIERHAGWVDLYYDGDKVEFPTNHEGIENEFDDALKYAIEQSREPSDED